MEGRRVNSHRRAESLKKNPSPFFPLDSSLVLLFFESSSYYQNFPPKRRLMIFLQLILLIKQEKISRGIDELIIKGKKEKKKS